MTTDEQNHEKNPPDPAGVKRGESAKPAAPAAKIGSGSGKAGSISDATGAFGSNLVAAVKTAQKDTSDPLVMAAFMLGWHMAQLFQPLPRPVNEVNDGDLSGLSSLGQRTRALMLVNSVQVGIGKLASAISATTLTVPNVSEVRKAAETAQLHSPSGDDQFHQALSALHRTLLTTLTAVDARFGRSYGLGRALADTCRKPHDLTGLAREFSAHRIGNLRGWLDELSTALPPHAAHSVSASLAQWSQWAQQAQEAMKDGGGPDERAELRAELGGTITKIDAIARAHRQGDLWRAVLAGEKRPQETLELSNYVKAAGESAIRMGEATRTIVGHFKLLTGLITLLIVVGIGLIAWGGAAKEVAGATSLLSAVGLTWKGLGGALGKLAGRLEQPVWGAVVDLAVTDAITLLPNNPDEKGGRQVVAVQMAAALAEKQKLGPAHQN